MRARGRSDTDDGRHSAAFSVVTATRDRPDSLARCLGSVRDQAGPDAEVIVVDSDPAVADARSVAARFGARYELVERPGLSRARNRGARLAQGDVIVFLDDDVTVEGGCIAALVAEFADPRVMVVGGRIVLEGGDDEVRRRFESFGGFDPGAERRVVDMETPCWFELANFGGLGSGAMLAVRRSAFEAWPGFDERLGRGAELPGGEELSAYFTLVSLGHRVVYTPAAVARHPTPASLRELKARVLEGAALGAAYLMLLLVEHPEFRRESARYAREGLWGKRRDWRPRSTHARDEVVSSWRLRLAWAAGPWLYAGMRLRVRWARGRACRPVEHGDAT